jgi:hypothetical protein
MYIPGYVMSHLWLLFGHCGTEFLLRKIIWSMQPHHSDKYSRLSVLARRYLAIPSTSVPSERIFSAAGLIVTKLRNRLSLLGRKFYCVRLKKVQLGSMTLLFSSFLFMISKFYISTLIVKIQDIPKLNLLMALFSIYYSFITNI